MALQPAPRAIGRELRERSEPPGRQARCRQHGRAILAIDLTREIAHAMLGHRQITPHALTQRQLPHWSTQERIELGQVLDALGELALQRTPATSEYSRMRSEP